MRRVDALRVGAVILPSNRKIFGYGGSPIPVVGETNVLFNYKGVQFTHTFTVVECNSPNLFGRDVAQLLKMKVVIPEDGSNYLNTVKTDILVNFKDYLSDDFQSAVTQQVKLNVQPDAVPIYCKARTVRSVLKVLLK